jgi:hypothetical protein
MAMKIAMFVAKDAALRRGSDTHGWRIADVPAVLISEQDREFLVAYCEPVADYKVDHDYAVRAMINPCHGSSRFDVKMPSAPDEGTDMDRLLQYLSTCRELVEKAVAAYKAEQAQEKAEEKAKAEARLAKEKKESEALAVRVLARDFSDEKFTRYSSNRIDIDILDSSETLSVYQGESEIVDKAFDYADAAVKRFRIVLEEREAKEAADKATAETKRRSAITAILSIHGRPDQVERWRVGCLPEEELDGFLRDFAHLAIPAFPRYVKMTEDDIEHVEDCCNPEAWFKGSENDPVTAAAWEKAEAIKASLPPHAESRIRLHKAHCTATGCDTETRKYALQVRIEIPDVGAFTREYELDGMFKVQL